MIWPKYAHHGDIPDNVIVCQRFGLSTFLVYRSFVLSIFWLSVLRFVDVLISNLKLTPSAMITNIQKRTARWYHNYPKPLICPRTQCDIKNITGRILDTVVWCIAAGLTWATRGCNGDALRIWWKDWAWTYLGTCNTELHYSFVVSLS